MTLKDFAYKLEDLATEAEKIESTQLALWQAIFRGDIATTSFEWAFVVFGNLTFDLKNNLQALSNEVFQALRKEG